MVAWRPLFRDKHTMVSCPFNHLEFEQPVFQLQKNQLRSNDRPSNNRSLTVTAVRLLTRQMRPAVFVLSLVPKMVQSGFLGFIGHPILYYVMIITSQNKHSIANDGFGWVFISVELNWCSWLKPARCLGTTFDLCAPQFTSGSKPW